LSNNYKLSSPLKICWAPAGATVPQVAINITRLITTEISSAVARHQLDPEPWLRLIGSPIIRTGDGAGYSVCSNVVCEFVVAQERPSTVKNLSLANS